MSWVNSIVFQLTLDQSFLYYFSDYQSITDANDTKSKVDSLPLVYWRLGRPDHHGR